MTDVERRPKSKQEFRTTFLLSRTQDWLLDQLGYGVKTMNIGNKRIVLPADEDEWVARMRDDPLPRGVALRDLLAKRRASGELPPGLKPEDRRQGRKRLPLVAAE